MKKIIMITLTLLAMCTAAAYAAEKPYFGYELDGNTLTVMENWELDKTEYQDKLFVLIYDGDKLIKAAPAQQGTVENEFVTTVPDGVENTKVKAAYVNDNGGLNIEDVAYYFYGVVDYVKADKDEVEIYFKEHSDGMPHHIKYNKNAADINITYNGEKTDHDSIEEWDVLSISCEPENDRFDDLSYYDIKVSRVMIEESLVNSDPADGFLMLGGRKYKSLVDDIFEYTYPYNSDDTVEFPMCVDAFGRVVYLEGLFGLGTPIDMIIGMSDGEGEFPVVRLLDIGGSKGYEWEMECKSMEEADKFYNFSTGTSEGYKGELTTEELMPRIMKGQTCCQSRLTNKLGFMYGSVPEGGSGLKYDSRTKMLGSFKIDEYLTAIYDISDFETSGKIKRLSLADLSEDVSYTAYLNFRNSYSIFWTVLITDKD